jgi:hypothetical protein
MLVDKDGDPRPMLVDKDGDPRSMLVDKDGEITLPWNGELFSPLRNEPIVRPHNPSLWTASL